MLTAPFIVDGQTSIQVEMIEENAKAPSMKRGKWALFWYLWSK